MSNSQVSALVSAAAAGDLVALKKLIADGVSSTERGTSRQKYQIHIPHRK
jgi:hypothetical protein